MRSVKKKKKKGVWFFPFMHKIERNELLHWALGFASHRGSWLRGLKKPKWTQNGQRERGSGKMPREKSPGLKILWLWTIGTAAGTLFLHFCLRFCNCTYACASYVIYDSLSCSSGYERGEDEDERHGGAYESWATAASTTAGNHSQWLNPFGFQRDSRGSLIGLTSSPVFWFWVSHVFSKFVVRLWINGFRKKLNAMRLMNVLYDSVKNHLLFFSFVFFFFFWDRFLHIL